MIFNLSARELSVVDFPNPIKPEISDLGYWEINQNEYITKNISISSLFLNQINTNKSYLKLGYKPNSRKEVFAASKLGIYKLALKLEQQNIENNFDSITHSYTNSSGKVQLDYNYAGIFFAHREIGFGCELYDLNDRFEDKAEYTFTDNLHPDEYTLTHYDYDKLAVTDSRLFILSIALRKSDDFSLIGKIGMGKRSFRMDINSLKEYDYIGELDFSGNHYYERKTIDVKSEYDCDQFFGQVNAWFKSGANEMIKKYHNVSIKLLSFSSNAPFYYDLRDNYHFNSAPPYSIGEWKNFLQHIELEWGYKRSSKWEINKSFSVSSSFGANFIPRFISSTYAQTRNQKVFEFNSALGMRYQPFPEVIYRLGVGWNYLKEKKYGFYGFTSSYPKWHMVTENPEYETLLYGGITTFPNNKICIDIKGEYARANDDFALMLGLALSASF